MNINWGATNMATWGKQPPAPPRRKVFSKADLLTSAEHTKRIMLLDEYLRIEVIKYFYLPPFDPKWGSQKGTSATKYKSKFVRSQLYLDWDSYDQNPTTTDYRPRKRHCAKQHFLLRDDNDDPTHQPINLLVTVDVGNKQIDDTGAQTVPFQSDEATLTPVSYTHLTLPTNREV